MTDRLSLRRFGPADLDDRAAPHADPAVMRFIDDGEPVPREVVAERALPEFLAANERLAEGLGRFVLAQRETGAFVGWVSIVPANSVGLEEYPGLELGYRLRSSMWGRGYAAEGARALIRRAFEDSMAVVRDTVTTASPRRRWR